MLHGTYQAIIMAIFKSLYLYVNVSLQCIYCMYSGVISDGERQPQTDHPEPAADFMLFALANSFHFGKE